LGGGRVTGPFFPSQDVKEYSQNGPKAHSLEPTRDENVQKKQESRVYRSATCSKKNVP
jgi:hypothetical protein